MTAGPARVAAERSSMVKRLFWVVKAVYTTPFRPDGIEAVPVPLPLDFTGVYTGDPSWLTQAMNRLLPVS